jgi:hypothetical protein
MGGNTNIPVSQGSRDQKSLGKLYNDHEAGTKLNWKNLTEDVQAYKNITYQVTFRVQIKVNFGETICVLGSIPELGKWKEFKYHLQWTEGDVWESITPLVTHSFYFQYKYALLEEKGTKLINWEKGIDRLADMEIMPDHKQGHVLQGSALSGPDLYSVNRAS